MPDSAGFDQEYFARKKWGQKIRSSLICCVTRHAPHSRDSGLIKGQSSALLFGKEHAMRLEMDVPRVE